MLAVGLPLALLSASPDAGPVPPALPTPPAVVTTPMAPPMEPAAPSSEIVQPDPPKSDPAKPNTPDPDPEVSDIIVTARKATPADPVAAFNSVSFDVLQVADQAIIAPVARGYKGVLPEEVRDGVTNALNNLDEPIVFANFVLQGKPRLALRTVARFAINSTLGIAGLIDVAKRKPFKLPRRSNGLADTLGYYGVKTGPFLFLPLIGPTTVRDVIGRVFDLSLVPFVVGGVFKNPVYSLSKGALSAIDDRVHSEDEGRAERFKSMDPYVATREYYLESRVKEIQVLRAEPGLLPRQSNTGTPPIQPQGALTSPK